MTHTISVEGHFSAAHVLPLDPSHKCSRLHGHNYTVTVRIKSVELNNHFVMDFGDVQKLLNDIISNLDHHVLLPKDLVPEEDEELRDGYYRFTHCTKRYVLPADDVTLIPIKATTSELLAEYIYSKLVAIVKIKKIPVIVESATVGENERTAATYDT